MTNSTRRFIADTAERAARTAAQGYFAVWLGIGGADFDTLFTLNNVKAAVVAVALSVAMSVGAKRVAARDSASFLPVGLDPPVKKTPAKKKPASRN